MSARAENPVCSYSGRVILLYVDSKSGAWRGTLLHDDDHYHGSIVRCIVAKALGIPTCIICYKVHTGTTCISLVLEEPGKDEMEVEGCV